MEKAGRHRQIEEAFDRSPDVTPTAIRVRGSEEGAWGGAGDGGCYRELSDNAERTCFRCLFLYKRK